MNLKTIINTLKSKSNIDYYYYHEFSNNKLELDFNINNFTINYIIYIIIDLEDNWCINYIINNKNRCVNHTHVEISKIQYKIIISILLKLIDMVLTICFTKIIKWD